MSEQPEWVLEAKKQVARQAEKVSKTKKKKKVVNEELKKKAEEALAAATPKEPTVEDMIKTLSGITETSEAEIAERYDSVVAYIVNASMVSMGIGEGIEKVFGDMKFDFMWCFEHIDTEKTIAKTNSELLSQLMMYMSFGREKAMEMTTKFNSISKVDEDYMNTIAKAIENRKNIKPMLIPVRVKLKNSYSGLKAGEVGHVYPWACPDNCAWVPVIFTKETEATHNLDGSLAAYPSMRNKGLWVSPNNLVIDKDTKSLS